MSDTVIKKNDRRSFLRGSALFAAAIGIAAVPGLASAGSLGAQQKPKPAPQPEEETEDPKPAPSGKAKDGKLYDKEGREYQVCPQCGYNVYKQGRMWICESCGYSYIE